MRYLRAVASRLEGLHMLQESSSPDLENLIPTRSGRVLLFPDSEALWHPQIRHMDATSSCGFSSFRLSQEDIRIWRTCNGSRTVREVANRTQFSIKRVLQFLASLTQLEIQAIQLRSEPIRSSDTTLSQFVGPRGQIGSIKPPRYLVHTFDKPHPGMGMESYGARLYRALHERGLLPQDGTTLEMSPPTTNIVRDWLRQSQDLGRPQGEFIRLESDGSDGKNTPIPGVRIIEGSTTSIPLPPASISLVLCTEIMSQLSAVPFDATTTANPTLSQGLAPAVAHAIDNYDLTHLPGRAWYHLGAWQLVEQIVRILQKGGQAVLIDQGSVHTSTEPDADIESISATIHFGHLIEVAQALGMEARTFELTDFLDVQLQTQWLSQHSYEALAAKLADEGGELPAEAWTPNTLKLPWPVEGIRWVNLADKGPGPLLTRMTVLLLRKP